MTASLKTRTAEDVTGKYYFLDDDDMSVDDKHPHFPVMFSNHIDDNFKVNDCCNGLFKVSDSKYGTVWLMEKDEWFKLSHNNLKES